MFFHFSLFQQICPLNLNVLRSQHVLVFTQILELFYANKFWPVQDLFMVHQLMSRLALASKCFKMIYTLL